jgi:2-polyprenyl-6-hydroxyphenyl methylase/3-demethylubiquinone-9 3-methyltransferase
MLCFYIFFDVLVVMESKFDKFNGEPLVTNTASAEEIDHFARLAAEWWDIEGGFKSLHEITPLRMTYVRDQICHHFDRDSENLRPFEKLSILDVGCGGGLICEPLVRLGANVTGIDAVFDNIEVAKRHASDMKLNINYQNILPEELILQSRKYDILINMEVIEHVSNADAFVMACSGLLNPGGLMVCSTLNRTIKSLALAKIMAEYILLWVPAGTHDWRKFVKPSEFCKYLRGGNLDVIDLCGMGFNPTKNCWNFKDNLDVNYFISAVKTKLP